MPESAQTWDRFRHAAAKWTAPIVSSRTDSYGSCGCKPSAMIWCLDLFDTVCHFFSGHLPLHCRLIQHLSKRDSSTSFESFLPQGVSSGVSAQGFGAGFGVVPRGSGAFCMVGDVGSGVASRELISILFVFPIFCSLFLIS